MSGRRSKRISKMSGRRSKRISKMSGRLGKRISKVSGRLSEKGVIRCQVALAKGVSGFVLKCYFAKKKCKNL